MSSELNEKLIKAVFNGKFEDVKKVLSLGANLHYKKDLALSYACCGGNIESYLEIVKYLIEQGSDVNADNGFPLLNAVHWGQVKIVKHLVESGADLHINNGIAFSRGFEGTMTNNKIEIIKYLIKKGSDIYQNKHEAIKYFLKSSLSQSELSLFKYIYKLYEKDNKEKSIESFLNKKDTNYLIQSWYLNKQSKNNETVTLKTDKKLHLSHF